MESCVSSKTAVFVSCSVQILITQSSKKLEEPTKIPETWAGVISNVSSKDEKLADSWLAREHRNIVPAHTYSIFNYREALERLTHCLCVFAYSSSTWHIPYMFSRIQRRQWEGRRSVANGTGLSKTRWPTGLSRDWMYKIKALQSLFGPCSTLTSMLPTSAFPHFG